jgi:long-subunit fatty acid transport protein
VIVQKFPAAPKILLMLAGLCCPHAALKAQAIWLPGSDPVNIGRAGAGVAYGRSLEAASLNPALLATLQAPKSAYLSFGMEMQSTQLTLPSNERVLFSSDRNRIVSAFGAGWRASPKLALGFRVDTPFSRHSELPLESSSRFFGQAISMEALRAELQASYAVTEAFSLGLSAGMAQLGYSSSVSLRALVPTDPGLPASDSNTVGALLETLARQKGSVLVPSYTIGFRYAATSRWTFGGSFASGLKGRPGLTASLPSRDLHLYNTRGDDSPPPLHGSEESARAVMAAIAPYAGDGDISLPYKIQAGVRNRYNQFMTWEFDLRYYGSSAIKMPDHAGLDTPSGRAHTLERDFGFKDCLALSAMMEINVNRYWTGRAGIAYDNALRKGQEADAMLGGARSVSYSIGLGYMVFGGEMSVGYQIRQAQDREINGLEGRWDRSGLMPTGSLTRVEGMGHLLSFGFKKSF